MAGRPAGKGALRLAHGWRLVEAAQTPADTVREFIRPAMDLVNKLLKLQASLVCLNRACHLEQSAAEQEKREAGWAGVKAHYYVEIRDEVFSAEWESLVGGDAAKAASEAVWRLEKALVGRAIDWSSAGDRRSGRKR